MDEHLKQTKAFFDSMAEKWDTFCYHDPAKLAAIVTLSVVKFLCRSFKHFVGKVYSV